MSAASSPLCIVFVVHGDTEFCATARRRLLKRSFAARVAADCAFALDVAHRRGCEIVVIKWPDRSAGTFAVATAVKTARSGTQIVVLSGHGSVESCVGAVLADRNGERWKTLRSANEVSPN